MLDKGRQKDSKTGLLLSDRRTARSLHWADVIGCDGEQLTGGSRRVGLSPQDELRVGETSVWEGAVSACGDRVC